MGDKNIYIMPHNDPAFVGQCVGLPCACCNHGVNDDLYDIEISRYIANKKEYKMTLCKNCLEELVKEAAHALGKSMNIGDTVWELVLCDDNVWRIFPMVVKSLSEHGSVRWVKDREPSVWNIYAESRDTCMYKSFYDVGKTLFLTEYDAEKMLKEKTMQNVFDREYCEVVNLDDPEVFDTFMEKAVKNQADALTYLAQWDYGENDGDPDSYGNIVGSLANVHTIVDGQYMALWQSGIESVTLYRAFEKK